MSTNQLLTQNRQPKPLKDEVKTITLKQPNLMQVEDEDSDFDSVIKLADTLNSVILNSPEADKNAQSISDNNGGRIVLNQDKIVKK